MSLGDALIMQCIKRGGSKMYVSISLIVSIGFCLHYVLRC
jgi:hypothetical protein